MSSALYSPEQFSSALYSPEQFSSVFYSPEQYSNFIKTYFKEQEEESTLSERSWLLVSSDSDGIANVYKAKSVFGAALNLHLDTKEVVGLILYNKYLQCKENNEDVSQFPLPKEMIGKSEVNIGGYLLRLLRAYPKVIIASPERKTPEGEATVIRIERDESPIQEGIRILFREDGTSSVEVEENFWGNLIKSRFSLTVKDATRKDYCLLKKDIHDYIGLAIYWYDFDKEIHLQRLEDESTEPLRYWGLGNMAPMTKPYVYVCAKTIFGVANYFQSEKRYLMDRVLDSPYLKKLLLKENIDKIKELKSRTLEESPLFPDLGEEITEKELLILKKELENELLPLFDRKREVVFPYTKKEYITSTGDSPSMIKGIFPC